MHIEWSSFWTQVIATVFNGVLVFLVTYYVKKWLERSRFGMTKKQLDAVKKEDAERIKKLKQVDDAEAEQIKKLETRLNKLERGGR